ncbi:hypothetical protein AGMMS49975_01040 [Clostridia bacterium]|nr:hypothetical protein AGMMS49975_01040 [Clostridia bacterium]
MENGITFTNVSKTFVSKKTSIHAINKLDLSIKSGEAYALLGHNGSGKTTTLRLILGLFRRDGGAISVFGADPSACGDEVRAMCGVLSEEVGLYEPLTVYDNLRFFAEIYGLSPKIYNARIDEMLKMFEIYDKKFLPIKGFSLGMKKKVALIRAFIHEPRILLLDEPTNGLDPVSTATLRTLIQDRAAMGATVIITTHNLDETQKICNRVSILRHGENIFTDSIKNLEENQDYWENGRFSLEKLYMTIEYL